MKKEMIRQGSGLGEEGEDWRIRDECSWIIMVDLV